MAKGREGETKARGEERKTEAIVREGEKLRPGYGDVRNCGQAFEGPE